MADPTTKDRPAQQWPSPWPYDFPTGGKVPQAPDKVARVTQTEAQPLQVTRRSLFSAGMLGWAAFLGANAVGGMGLTRFLFPTVSFEPPMQFKTKSTASFSANTVDETWKESNAVWMVQVEGKIIAISTVCTHLGCTPNWLNSENKFKCPCHGSGYYMNGVNFEGPTPRPLERFRVFVNKEDGLVWVDKSLKCEVQKEQCDDSKFFIPVA
jgi:cytochrome b6-f complex iron-sulfur subunit